MNILLTATSFHYLTGAEMYVYELGRELVLRGHRVTVAANRVEGEMAAHARAAGIEAYRFCDIRPQPFDVIHASQPEPTRWALAHWPHTPVLCTVHSQYPCEKPLFDPRIRHYVCVRPEVQTKIINEDKIPLLRTSVIYNPIDFSRFKPAPSELGKSRAPRRVLFCGTIDPLRKETILDLIRGSITQELQLTLLGRKADSYDGYIETLPPSAVWHDQTWNVEPFIHACDETAGVHLGRTTIEGWACGKPGWIYDVDLKGRLRSRRLYQPPKGMSDFDSGAVVDQLLFLYRTHTAVMAGAGI